MPRLILLFKNRTNKVRRRQYLGNLTASYVLQQASAVCILRMQLEEGLWHEGSDLLLCKHVANEKQILCSENAGATCEKSGESRTVNAERSAARGC